jgi:hypothetical protein
VTLVRPLVAPLVLTGLLMLTLLTSLTLPTPATVSSLLATLLAGSALLASFAGSLALSALAALLAPSASLASLAVPAIHVFVLAHPARVGPSLRASMVALLLAVTAATLVLASRLLLAVAAFARLVGWTLLAVRAALTMLTTLTLLATLTVPVLSLLSSSLTVLAGFLMLGVSVADVLMLVRLVMLARPLRFASSGSVSFARGLSCSLLPVGHLFVLVLSVTSTASPTALSVSCHNRTP